MKNVVCFDVGGTFIKHAVINSDGEILCKGKFPTPDHDCKVTIPENMINIVEELKQKYELHSIGISTAGLIDSKNGVVIAANNFPGYNGARLAETVKKGTGLDTYVENDVNAAALGEMWMGAAKGSDTFVCIALGTGVGGAIIIDGKVVKGVSGAAGEIGHMVVNEQGEQCGCGTVGCYERYASTSAFIRSYINRAREQGIKIHENAVNGEVIMELVDNGDKLAAEVYNDFLEHVVTGIVSVTHLLDPGLIVLGGGISAQGQKFFHELNRRFRKRAMADYAEHTNIVQAQLQNDAGIYGACYIAL
ncbi:ROK family protein [Clostridium omnivorum]|uniref:Sugar kinase n=1 Tax=Clostridium omnivorum TaxID=1604902 RepID=A0ABQ5N6L2_9CLOT|nr:ROK family protein [Clostridium sp. E14]GLC30882.1 sugar kinase [Clostridium sp. E14]